MRYSWIAADQHRYALPCRKEPHPVDQTGGEPESRRHVGHRGDRVRGDCRAPQSRWHELRQLPGSSMHKAHTHEGRVGLEPTTTRL